MEIDERYNGATWRWSLLFSVVFLNVCLPNLVLVYGILWVHSSELEVPLRIGFLTPALLLLTYCLTQCWFREAADSWGGSIGYRVMAAIGLLMVVVGLLLCAFVPLCWQPFVYGLLGGLGSSLISAQVDAVIFETYDSRIGIVRGICCTGQAVGQSLFPHIITVLINVYGYSYSFIVLGGIMLQTLPAVLFLKIDETVRKTNLTSRHMDLYESYSGFHNSGADNYFTAELQLHDLSKKCWKSPSDDNLHREDDEIDEDSEVIGTITPPPSPEEKRRNIFGVDILPDIPEESEESDEDIEQGMHVKEANDKQGRLSIAIKRLSTLGDNLDEYIIKQARRDSKDDCSIHDSKEYSELEVKYETISPITDIQREKIFNSFGFRCQSTLTNIKRRFWIPSYRVYRVKRRLLYTMYSVNDTFIKPLTRSLSCWKFYPALLLSFAKLSLSAVSLTLLPSIAQQIRPKIAIFETNFLMSLHGFTWICFLLSTPWLAQTPKRNFKYVTVMGLIVTSAACFVLAGASNHDVFAVGCVISGLGYGAVILCSETTVQDFVGARKWPKLHSTLETLSAILLALFVVGLSFFVDLEGGSQYPMFLLGTIMCAITLVWFVVVAVSLYQTKLRYFRPNWHWLF